MNVNATHTVLMPSNLSSSSPLSDLLAVDSVADVFAYLQDESIVENPDARLQAFSNIIAHIGSHYTGNFNPSKKASFDPAPTPSSQESGTPLDANRWKWADVLMRGVTDPWSRVRAMCLSPMADLLLSEVHEALTLQGMTGSEQQALVAMPERARPTHSAPGPSRRHSAGKIDEKKKANVARKERRRSVESCKQSPQRPPNLSPIRNVHNASAPLDYIWHYWDSTTRWYEHDGIVRLLVKAYSRSRTIPGAALRSDDAGIRTLLFKVLFPAFRDPQLPVRESAAALLGVLVDPNRASPISPAIISFIVDQVRDTLAKVPTPICSRSPLTLSDQENTHVLEGNLLALVVLVDMNVLQVADASIMPLLLRLASYPASSVRQYIAQILRPPSPPVFVYLMRRLCEQGDHPLHSSDMDTCGGDDEGGEFSWQRQETVMMALQQHYLNIASISATTRDWIHASPCSGDILALMRGVTPLSVVFHAMLSPRFEVARMGAQLFPLILQSSVRFLPPADLPRVCEACCGANGCMQQELQRLQAKGYTQALSRAQLAIATIVLPGLWFFLVVRRLKMEVVGGRRDEVERAIRPYATLDCVRFASQPHVSKDKDSGCTPCEAPTCSLLILVAYFARVMDPAEWHRCVEEVLRPSWWADLLSNPVRREQVRFGPDFVRAVQHCGTPAQSQRILELFPTLTAMLADAQTHQQCLIITMIRVAVSACAAVTGTTDERAMAYVYHDVYAAPALTEGGEAAPLGHMWLKLFVPTQDAIPTTVFWEPRETSAGGEAKIVIRRDSDVFRAIDKVCLKDLFQSSKTERPVLRELRSLMMSLSCLSACDLNSSAIDGNASNDGSNDAADVDWYALALESVFGRLDKVCPRWRERANDGDAAEADAGEEEDKAEDICWDDWDDDEENEDGCAQGIYEAEVIKSAVSMVSALRERAAARSHDSGKVSAVDKRYRNELAALNIKS
jgi:hypothetical protein